jgi:hypothetical protein
MTHATQPLADLLALIDGMRRSLEARFGARTTRLLAIGLGTAMALTAVLFHGRVLLNQRVFYLQGGSVLGDLTAATLLSAGVALALNIARLPRSASALMSMAGTAQLLKPVLFPQFDLDYAFVAGRSVAVPVPCTLFEAQHPDLFSDGVLLLALAVGLFLARRHVDVGSATAQPGIHAAQQTHVARQASAEQQARAVWQAHVAQQPHAARQAADAELRRRTAQTVEVRRAHAAQQALAAASRIVAAEDEAPTQLFIRRPSLQADAA